MMLRTYTTETAIDFTKASVSGKIDEVEYHEKLISELNRKLDALEEELQELGM